MGKAEWGIRKAEEGMWKVEFGMRNGEFGKVKKLKAQSGTGKAETINQ